jgi:hypothetical protein
VEIEGFGESGGPASLRAPTESGGELRRVGEPRESDRGWAKNLSKDWGGDGGVWGSGSGCAGGVGYTDHGGGGLPDRGEGKGVGNQFDLRRASGDGSFWCEGAG